jgi:hypothetical protein
MDLKAANSAPVPEAQPPAAAVPIGNFGATDDAQ